MTTIKLVTLAAGYEESWDDDLHDSFGVVVLRFGDVEVARWPSEQTYFRDDDDRDEYVQQVVAEKLGALLQGDSRGRI